MSALLSELGLNAPPAGGDPASGAAAPPPPGPADLPPSMPDPEPHLADQGPLADAGADAAAGTPPDPTADASMPQDEVGVLEQMLELAQSYGKLPGVQTDERHKMAKAVTVITGLLDSNQKAHDAVTGTNAALRKVAAQNG